MLILWFRCKYAILTKTESGGNRISMESIQFIFDFILHIDVHLENMIQSYGLWTFGILWGIIFSETGLVFLPFLPGDSLLFAAGALSAKSTGNFNVGALIAVCISAAFIGNTVNYFIGQFFGEKILSTSFFKKIIKPEQLEKSRAFFEKHGVVSIVLARFIPIVRTIVPFIAGVSEMTWKKYTLYNLIGAVTWVTLFIMTGYLFGNIPFVAHNFSLVVIAIVFISLVPLVLELIRNRRQKVNN